MSFCVSILHFLYRFVYHRFSLSRSHIHDLNLTCYFRHQKNVVPGQEIEFPHEITNLSVRALRAPLVSYPAPKAAKSRYKTEGRNKLATPIWIMTADLTKGLVLMTTTREPNSTSIGARLKFDTD